MLDFFLRVFCKCRETITRADGPRLYTECLRCGAVSPGVVTGKAAALLVAAFALLISGCGGPRYQHRLVMHASDVRKIVFNPKNCKPLSNGNVICNGVVFVPGKVSIE